MRAPLPRDLVRRVETFSSYFVLTVSALCYTVANDSPLNIGKEPCNTIHAAFGILSRWLRRVVANTTGTVCFLGPGTFPTENTENKVVG